MEAHVITRLCQDCLHGDCLDVCPVECIVQHDEEGLPNQLFIQDHCIFCGACEAACPEKAIFAFDDVPQKYHDDIALNAIASERPSEFSVPNLVDLAARLAS